MMFPYLRCLSRLFSTTTINPNTPRSKPIALFNERNLDRLVASFKLSSHSYRFRCRHNIFLSTVGRLSTDRRHGSVREILNFQKQFKDDFSNEGFGIRLVSLYGKARMADDAERTFDEMDEVVGERRCLNLLNMCLKNIFVFCEKETVKFI